MEPLIPECKAKQKDQRDGAMTALSDFVQLVSYFFERLITLLQSIGNGLDTLLRWF